MAQQSQYQWHFNKDCYPPSPLLLIVQFQPLHTPQINTFADSSLAAIDSPFGVRVAEEMILTIRRFWLGIECPIYPRSRLSAEARESLDGSWLCTVPWGLGNSTRFIADSHLHIYSPWGKRESLFPVAGDVVYFSLEFIQIYTEYVDTHLTNYLPLFHKL